MGRKRTSEDRRDAKHEILIERVSKIAGCMPERAEQMMRVGLHQSVRVNPLKGDPAETAIEMKRLGWGGTKSEWTEHCYSIEYGFEALRDSELVTQGKIYIQNASSWLPVIALDPRSGESILDVCAAPGGKTSFIAACMNNQGRLVANDNSKPRLAKLRSNMDRLGANAEYTLKDATRLASSMSNEIFDKILIDAPCSGEGLINLDNPKSLDTWSVAHIRRLATLQKQIINQAWQLLRPGGVLVYSTCTMAPEEDEAVIDHLLRRHANAQIESVPFVVSRPISEWNDKSFNDHVQKAGRVFPNNGNEAFFVCKIRKSVGKCGGYYT